MLLALSHPQPLSGIAPTVRRKSHAHIVAEDREQQLIDRHFGFKHKSTSHGEDTLDELIASCNDARSIRNFTPKGFIPAIRYTNLITCEKQIATLQALQKRRSRATDADYDLVEKTLHKIKADSILKSKDNKVLVALIERYDREKGKKLKECQQELNQRQSEFTFMQENVPPAMRLFPVDDA